MTTDLAVVQQLHNTLDLPERDRGAAEAVAAGLRDAKAENTRRAYASAWRQFRTWAEAGGHPALPAAPQAVALYLGHLASKRPVHRHRPAGPLGHLPLSRRRRGAEGRQSGLPPGGVRGGQGVAQPGPRLPGRQEPSPPTPWPGSARFSVCPREAAADEWSQQTTARRRAALDLAIIGVMADGGLRRSEAASLTWGDVEYYPDGTARITIQKGKNKPEPATVAVAVTGTTARALTEIQPNGDDPSQSVFNLTGETLANRVRAAARAAGLGDGFSGHSGRIGMARRMVVAGAPNAAVQNQGRWKHGDMVARYTRGEAAGEVLKWLS